MAQDHTKGAPLVQHIRQRGPVTRRYRVEFDLGRVGDTDAQESLKPPAPDAPLREHREWAAALKILFPDAKVELRSLPGMTADTVRQLKPVVKRGK